MSMDAGVAVFVGVCVCLVGVYVLAQIRAEVVRELRKRARKGDLRQAIQRERRR